MAKIVITADADEDLYRLVDFLADKNRRWATEAMVTIRDGLRILSRHPLVGHPVENSVLRELVISKGRSGYLALYRYNEISEEITVLAIRHQREAGYS